MRNMNESNSSSESDSNQTVKIPNPEQQRPAHWGEGPPPKWLFGYWLKKNDTDKWEHKTEEGPHRWFGDRNKETDNEEFEPANFKEGDDKTHRRKWRSRWCNHKHMDETMQATGNGPDSDSVTNFTKPGEGQHGVDSDSQNTGYFMGFSKDPAWRRKMIEEYSYRCPYFSKLGSQKSSQERIFDEFSMENGN